MAKLSWEYDANGTDIIIKKGSGKLTIQEVFDFLHEPKQTSFFDGALMAIVFRVNSERDIPYNYEEQKGDAQLVFVIGDDAECPICGNTGIAVQYCPDCGKKLF